MFRHLAQPLGSCNILIELRQDLLLLLACELHLTLQRTPFSELLSHYILFLATVAHLGARNFGFVFLPDLPILAGDPSP